MMSRAAWRLRLLVLAPGLAAAAALGAYLAGGRYLETDNAYVKADKVPVSAEVAGAIREVLVTENQAVAKGEVLFRLRRAAYEVAVSRAEAKLAQARADHAALRASYHGKQAEIAGEYLRKGRQVYVEGALQTREWTDREGNKRQTTEIRAQRFQMLGGRGEAEGAPAPEAATGELAEPDRAYGEDDIPF